MSDLFGTHVADEEFFIPGNVPSSKNSKDIQTIKKGPRSNPAAQTVVGYRLSWSKAAIAYRKDIKEYMNKNRDHWLNLCACGFPPYMVGFHFVKSSRRKFDWCNAVQTISDLMVEYEWIADDNITEFIPCPLFKPETKYGWFSVSKEKPGVYVKLLSMKSEEVIKKSLA